MPIDTKPPKEHQPTEYRATERPELLRTFSQIQSNIKKWKKNEKEAELVVDVRLKAKFDGLLPEYDPRVQPGHMPFSRNLPYMKLLDHRTGELLRDDLLIHLIGQDYKH
jgi:3-mercaptopyruvate sulfurtransferase SseA